MIAKNNLAYKESVLTDLMVTNVHVNLVGKENTVMKVRKKFINPMIHGVKICHNSTERGTESEYLISYKYR